MKIFGCHGNELPIKKILYQSVFGDKYYMIEHKFTISATMNVSPFAWCLARAVLKKWSGGGNHRVPTAREGESTRGGSPLSLGGLGGFPRENFEFLALLQ